MRKKMLSVVLALCMLLLMLPVTAGAANMQSGSADYESLKSFLQYFAWTWSAFDSYDAQNATSGTMASESLLELVLGNPSCCNFSIYPIQQPEDVWGGTDPLGRWEESYRKSEAADIEWILKNIFNCSDADISTMREALAHSQGSYYLNGNYYTSIDGAGGGFVVKFLDMEQVDQRYHVHYTVSSSYTPDVIMHTRYAVVEQKTIDGKKYWTLHAYSDQPIESGLIAPGEFRDVKESDYYYNAVKWAVNQQIATGTGNAMFAPEKSCTAAEALVMLWRANGSPLVDDYTIYSNLSNQYYFTAVRWAVKQGLISRTDFNPSTPCTRSMFIEYLWMLAGEPVSRTYSFSDVSASEKYAKAVSWAVDNGIAAGTSSTTFSPSVACTRAQIVTLLWRSAGNERLAPPTSSAASASSNSNWSDAYKNFILNEEYLICPLSYTTDDASWGSEAEPNVSLYDLDSDGIPELIMTNGYTGRVMLYAYVFTYENGTVKSIGTGPADASYIAGSQYNGIFGYFHLGGSDHSWTYYWKSDGQMKNETVRVIMDGKIDERTNNAGLYAQLDREMTGLPGAKTSEIRSMGWDSFVNKALAR